LAALIDRINRTRYEHIVTIEDPIEFVHESINCLVSQREVGEDKDTKSFKQALVSSLRQDPDVILVGEMRDLDTMETAVTAAETGHLVFGTLHTQNAVQSVERVVNVFGEREQDQIRVQLAATLQGICSQILIPTRDGSTRVPAVEVLLPTSAVRSNIRDHKEHLIPNSIQTGMAQGMQSMDYSLAQLVKKGLIDREVALAKARDENEFKSLVAGGAGAARFTSGG
jgi:twitching motility protein PilT